MPGGIALCQNEQMTPRTLKKVKSALGYFSLAFFVLSCTAFYFFFATLKEEPPPTMQMPGHETIVLIAIIALGMAVFFLLATVVVAVLGSIKETKTSSTHR